MEKTAEQTAIEREIAIAASPETVWQFLVDPEKSRTWWGQASFDLRPGGALRMEITPRSVASGEFVEVDPPRRLVYTWGWESGGGGAGSLVPPGSSTVEIELVPTGQGTTLRLVHRGLPTPEAVTGHGEGWDHYLGRLAVAAPGGDPGPDPWAQAEA
jgi:uncharacterized protein YndB with AHSA1/START domain